MVFLANQEQNESYTSNAMLLQPDKKSLILDILKEVEAHEARSHFSFMKKSEVNNKPKKRETQDYFIHLVFQAEEIDICKINETQNQTLYIWRNTTMGS